jgi:hypothetical protein
MVRRAQQAAAVARVPMMTGLDQVQTKEPASCMAKTRRIDAAASRMLPRKSILETAVVASYLLRRSSGQRA